jgi:hypothetical protein
MIKSKGDVILDILIHREDIFDITWSLLQKTDPLDYWNSSQILWLAVHGQPIHT